MSFILQNNLDKSYISKLCQQIKLIKQSKIDWTVEHVIRFANLIQIDEIIKEIIVGWEIDGSKLFDIQYLNANLDCLITDRNYMPLYKLFYVVNAILLATESLDNSQQSKEEKNLENQVIEQGCIDISEDSIVKIKQELKKMNNINIIELGSAQLARILKNASLIEESQSVIKWSVDGFSLLCILGGENQNQSYKNYFSIEDLRLLNKLSHLFIHLYYWQHSEPKNVRAQVTNEINLEDDFGIDFNDINFDKQSFHSSQYGVSEAGDIKPEQLRNSEFGVSVRGSLATSQFENSLQQSTRGSMAESVYASSQIMEDQTQNSFRGSVRNSIKEEIKVVAISSIEDDSIAAILMDAALKLPFNLLNLEPLQKIKICSLPYPFNLNKGSNLVKKQSIKDFNAENATIDNSSQKSQSIYDLIDEDEEIRQFRVFNLSGAKFGRSPENDFSYPDQLSISGKHAQIVFKDESYYLRDLGSKTGTFVYISEKKPLVLIDEQLVQLSYEVEFKVMIVKSDLNEGIIKFQFKKPDNQPPYRAILKNNNTVRIGKAENSHIKLNNQSISSYHAQIKYQEGKFIMYDCNTRTGTWLRLSSKGVRSADRKLSKWDIIRISSKKTFLIQDMNEGIQFSKSTDHHRDIYDH